MHRNIDTNYCTTIKEEQLGNLWNKKQSFQLLQLPTELVQKYDISNYIQVPFLRSLPKEKGLDQYVESVEKSLRKSELENDATYYTLILLRMLNSSGFIDLNSNPIKTDIRFEVAEIYKKLLFDYLFNYDLALFFPEGVDVHDEAIKIENKDSGSFDSHFYKEIIQSIDHIRLLLHTVFTELSQDFKSGKVVDDYTFTQKIKYYSKSVFKKGFNDHIFDQLIMVPLGFFSIIDFNTENPIKSETLHNPQKYEYHYNMKLTELGQEILTQVGYL